MTKARNLKRCDKLQILMNFEVLSVEPIENNFIKVKVAAMNAATLNFADDNGTLEFTCRPYRDFGAYPWRGDDDDGDGDDGDDIDPLTPNDLEPVE